MTEGTFSVWYAPSKVGKSTASGAAGACGLFIAQPGGLLPVKTFLGLDNIKYQSAGTVAEAAMIIRKKSKGQPTVVVDDFSLLVEQTVAGLEGKCGFGEMWRQLRSQVLEMRNAARVAAAAGTHVIFNCHESPPRTSSGKYVRGGPSLPGQLPEQFSAFADIVARGVYDPTAAPWKYVFRTSPDPQYISGDRLDILPDPAPMNIAEAFRAAGYDIPRPKELKWQEKVVEQLSERVLSEGIASWRSVLKPAAEKLSTKYPLPHVRWTLQDALHRAVILDSKLGMLDKMFEESDQDIFA